MNTRKFVRFGKLAMRMFTLGTIFISLLATTGLGNVQAKSPRMLTGDTYFYVAEWGGVEIWTIYNIKEVDPTTGTARGTIRATVYDPWNGWKSLVFVPECVKFTEDRVTVVMEITQKTGMGNGEVGEHAKWQIYDGGSPGIGKDAFTIINYQLDPWIEYWPVGAVAPDCATFDPVPGWETPVFVTAGNLTIH